VKQVMERLASPAIGCSGLTPLGEALCEIHPLGHMADDESPNVNPGAKLLLLTDGMDTDSTGTCAGKDDADGLPPYDVGSWQAPTFSLMSGLRRWSLQTVLFTPSSGTTSHRDPETGEPVEVPKRVAFLSHLSSAAGGFLGTVADDEPLLARVAPDF
jgi:hypothetical protein